VRVRHELKKSGRDGVEGLGRHFGKEKKDVGAINALRQALAQPEREWVGLTDEEIQAERHKLDPTAGWTYDHFARAIEAKLKEKNGG
jgi:hypothetical protein